MIGLTLERLAAQTRPLDRLVVVDNEGSSTTESIVRAAGLPVEYVTPTENLGFCGGVADGMRRALVHADDDDWIVLLDDDDPPRFDDAFERLHRFAVEMRSRDPRTAAVGVSGGWFDWRRGRMRRVRDDELRGAVPVDHLAGNNLPFFQVGAVRDVGPFSDELFFGYSELEYGLRLWSAGYTLYGHGALWLESRRRSGRLGHSLRPSRPVDAPTWRDYYSLRNVIHILRRFGHPWVAARVSFETGLAKPLWNLPRRPVLAIRRLRLNLTALLDGWTGRMGRRVEPDGTLRVGKAVRTTGRLAAVHGDERS